MNVRAAMAARASFPLSSTFRVGSASSAAARVVGGKPSAQQCFIAMQKWDDPSDCNYNGGDFIVTFRFKARNQKDADKKLATKLGNSGREFYALAAEHAPG